MNLLEVKAKEIICRKLVAINMKFFAVFIVLYVNLENEKKTKTLNIVMKTVFL